jgi:putative MATE family efflux protein
VEGENKITQGVIWKQILVFFFPILLGTFFQQLYNTADAMIVGNFVGKSALAAVGGGTGTIVNLLVGFFVGVSAGSTVIISQYFGAGKRRETSQAVHTSIALGIVGGAVLMVLGLVFSPMILGLMDTPDEVMGSAVTYISIYFGGMIFNLLYNMGAGILRAIGDSKRPLYYLMVCTIVNIVLDLMFVAVFNMGVAGAGIATVMSQVISALLVLRRLIKTNECYKLNVKEIKFTGFILKNIIAIGLPTGLQSVMYNLSNIFLQAAVNSLGVNVMAAWSAYQKIDGLFWMIMTAFGTAVTTFAGQNFGAGRYDRVRGSVRACLIMSFITSAILSSILMLLSGTAFKLFSNEAEVVTEGVSMMRSLVPFYFTYVCVEILSGAMRGTGESLVPMILTALGVCVLRIVWVQIMMPVWNNMHTITYSYVLSWSVTSVMFIVYYLHGGWLRRQIRRAGMPPEVRKKREKVSC